jgi:hypothetical protein
MKKEITMTKDGGFYYRATAFHYLFTYSILIFIVAVIIIAVINPFWFREDFMRWCESSTHKIARWRDKIKYRIYLGTDPEVWHALKDGND